MDEQSKQRYHDIFTQADKRSRGFLYPQELKMLLETNGYSFHEEGLENLVEHICGEHKKVSFHKFLSMMNFLIEMHQLFLELDENGDENLSKAEFAHAIKKMKFELQKEQLDLMFQITDTNRNGLASFEEFVSTLLYLYNIKRVFESADTEGNGTLDTTEFYKFLPILKIKASKHDAQQALSQFDLDNDGELNFPEFVHFIFTIRDI
ncbi:programmed cell death 6 [Anaeramoeba ignava]|uniref:Programmed cell death 6 n=1 Tax=Anaeramoeba ignava TaxID=1746090 RepID=A0A9Q0R8P9_ANAIG|nr:programmed cell death 6 [Anaeramoeba ignava]